MFGVISTFKISLNAWFNWINLQVTSYHVDYQFTFNPKNSTDNGLEKNGQSKGHKYNNSSIIQGPIFFHPSLYR